MSFQAYIDTIRAKTGKGPDEHRAWAEAKGFLEGGRLAPTLKAMSVVAALKDDLGLGHGHAMAVVALLKGSMHADGVS